MEDAGPGSSITDLAGAVGQGRGPKQRQRLLDKLQRAQGRGDVDHGGFLAGHARDVAGLGRRTELRQELLLRRAVCLSKTNSPSC